MKKHFSDFSQQTLLPALLASAMAVCIFTMPLSPLQAVELNIPRQGIVENVPAEEPYNGCLLVREGPGGSSAVKGYVTNGTTVQIEATDGAWYKITAPKTGYVYSTYVKITETATIDPATRDKPLSLEEIAENSDPWNRATDLDEKQKLLENNDNETLPGMPANP
ncbi:MAG TPA: SH3 domain-containing protein [Candidatus Rifleibacterium sp.]|nr:SH3 domain-containing protein [Candidatus Rifleibacterium sp.]